MPKTVFGAKDYAFAIPVIGASAYSLAILS